MRGLARAWRAGVSLAALTAALSGPVASTASAETLREALAMAYQWNPKLDAERARLRATDEDVSRAQAGWRPVVTAEADAGLQSTTTKPASTSSGSSNPYGYQVSLRQPIFRGFRTTAQVEGAEANVRAGREGLRQVENAVLLDAVTAYVDVVRDQGIVKLREHNVEALTKELEAAETRRAVREVTRTDVAQARARRARAVSAADVAKSNLKISRAAFARVIGHVPSRLVEPPLRNKLLPRSLEEALHAGETESPNVNSALYREEAARHAVDAVRGELLPEVRLEASYGREYNSSTHLDQQDSASVTGRVTMPLYEGGEVYARVRQAKHTHVSRLQEIEQARTETDASVTAAWARMIAARAQLKSDEVQVEANRIALEGVREEERVGQRTLLDVLNAEQEYLDSQVQMLGTRHDLVVASYALLAQMGSLTSDRLALTDSVYDAEEHYHEVRLKWFGLSITRADGQRDEVRANDPEEDIPVNE